MDTGTPLKNGTGWVKRWYRITTEDAQLYKDECAKKVGELHRQKPTLPPGAVKDEMAIFRSEWLKDHCENRNY
jgi:hypothetical protein